MQGSTADGALYRSETATFTIPEPAPSGEAAAGADREPNLALDATGADVSSEFNDSFAATNAIDDSGTSEWSSAGDGDDAFVTIDLDTSREIAGVEFITRSMLDGTAVTETFTVTVDDGATLGPFPAGTPAEPNFAAIETTGRTSASTSTRRPAATSARSRSGFSPPERAKRIRRRLGNAGGVGAGSEAMRSSSNAPARGGALVAVAAVLLVACGGGDAREASTPAPTTAASREPAVTTSPAVITSSAPTASSDQTSTTETQPAT